MAKKEIKKDDMAKHFRSKMKVGWEDTFIAENIFTQAASGILSQMVFNDPELNEAMVERLNTEFETLAKASCQAVRVWPSGFFLCISLRMILPSISRLVLAWYGSSLYDQSISYRAMLSKSRSRMFTQSIHLT